MANVRGLFVVGVVANLVGCVSPASSSPSSSASDSRFGSSLSPGAVVDLDACTEGLSTRTVDDQLSMVFDLEQSYHEMVACGGLVGALASAVIEVVESIIDEPNGGLPSGFTREGGVYTAAPGGDSNTVMTAGFYFGDDYEAGAQGERIEANIFALKSYLERPRVDFDYTTGEVLVRYDSRGPLVELLGFGANPPRPLRLSPGDLAGITDELEKVRIGTEVFVDDDRASSTVVYELESDRISIGSILQGNSFAFEAVSATAFSDASSQQMTTVIWDIAYDDGSRGLDGDIEYTVTGGDFDYVGTFEYHASTWPDTTVRCAE